MGIDTKTLALANTHTDESIRGYGVQAGKNCQVISTTPIEGGTKVTFGYYDDNQVKKESSINVMNGADGSVVNVEQILAKGTKIAIITVDGTPVSLYAPTGGGGSSTLDGLEDVDLTNPTDGQVLVYDIANQVWKNANLPEVAKALASLTDVDLDNPTNGQVLTYNATTQKWENKNGGSASISELGDIGDVNLSELADGQMIKWDAATSKWVNANVPSGGDATLETAVTSNLAVGAIASGTTLPEGTTFTEFAQKLLITEIAPTTTFTASGSGVKEVGTSVTPTLTLTITGTGTGTPTAIKFYDGSTLLDTQSYVSGTNTYTYTMSAVTTTKTVKGVLEYKKSDESTASIEKSATYTFVMASYYGAVATAPTDKAGIIALTKNVKNTKALTTTFTLSNQRSCYCYPASFGNLTSIKDANNFEYLASYTKTTVTVDGVDYNVYTLTDAVTATGFKQVYA